MPTPALRIENLTKSFPGVRALRNVSMDIYPGEVHALVGENGAGKSTLMKILNGNYAKDGGNIFLNGRKVDIGSPKQAMSLGISIIFQELNLENNLSVGENIFLGRLSEVSGSVARLDWRLIHEKARSYIEKVHGNFSSRDLVGGLSIAQKQLVEIAKALSFDANIILMDEPSATLTDNELDTLFSIVSRLRAENRTVIYISHRLEEIFRIADRVTVLRDGEVVAGYLVADVDKNTLIRDMVGRALENAYPPKTNAVGSEYMVLRGLSRRDTSRSVSFSVKSGEILGFAGLVGAGRTEVMRCLFGADYCKSIDISIDGRKRRIRKPEEAIRHGIGFVTENRKEEGLVTEFEVAKNITMASLRKVGRLIFLSFAREKSTVNRYVDMLGIKTPSLTKKVAELSGGNQQKIVLSKWINADAKILILDEPTRGIDVGAKYEVYKIIMRLASEGKCILFVSSDLPELIALSDRIVVMRDGGIAGILQGAEASAEAVMALACG